jgi:hypothetical protein
MKYWFKPLRFWKWFACYYPASFAGWMAAIFLFLALVLSYLFAGSAAQSLTEKLLAFAPWALVILLLFDLLCFRFGKYPSWWKKHKRSHGA